MSPWACLDLGHIGSWNKSFMLYLTVPVIHLLSYSSHQLKNKHYGPGLMNMYHLGANHNNV